MWIARLWLLIGPCLQINALARKSSGAAPVHKASSFGSIPRAPSGFSLSPSGGGSAGWAYRDTPNLSRAESMASTAVRAADKIKVGLPPDKRLIPEGNHASREQPMPRNSYTLLSPRHK